MEALLVLVFIGLIVGAGVVYMRGRKQATAGEPSPTGLPQAPAAEPVGGVEARALKLGDVVNHEGRDWIVEGTLRFEQGGFRWAEHRLVDGADSLWLSVEDDEGLELVIWTRVRGGALEPGPGSARARRRDVRARRAAAARTTRPRASPARAAAARPSSPTT